LVIELTAQRTLALRNAVASDPHVAMTALLHKLVSDRFMTRMYKGTMEAGVKDIYFPIQDDTLNDCPAARAVHERHAAWAADIPKDDDALWDWLATLDDVSRMALLAHCVSYGVNALYERPNPLSASGISEYSLEMRLAQADRLARVTGLDMVDAGWRPTFGNYLNRVTKPRILEAVREGAGERAAQLIEHLKKGDMARKPSACSPTAAGYPSRSASPILTATKPGRPRRTPTAAKIPRCRISSPTMKTKRRTTKVRNRPRSRPNSLTCAGRLRLSRASFSIRTYRRPALCRAHSFQEIAMADTASKTPERNGRITRQFVHVAIYEHPHGEDVRVFHDKGDAWDWRTPCPEWWSKEFDDESPSRDVIGPEYFDRMGDKDRAEYFSVLERVRRQRSQGGALRGVADAAFPRCSAHGPLRHRLPAVAPARAGRRPQAQAILADAQSR
jgi:hypothetical protein